MGIKPIPKSRFDISSLVVKPVAIGLLQPFDRNPRDHGKAHVNDVARSISQFGMIVPILCDELFVIIAGHATLLACQALSMKQVPVIQLGHLSEAEKVAFRIAHNKLCESGKWDLGLLAANFDMLISQDLEFDLALTGFTTGEVDIARMGGKDKVKAAAAEAATREDFVALPEKNARSISRLGDRFVIGEHVVVHGDARDIAAYKLALGDNRCDLVLCDPPYNIEVSKISGGGKTKHNEFVMGSGEMSNAEFQSFIADGAKLQSAFCKPGAYVCLFTAWYSMADMLFACQSIYQRLAHICIWKKTNGGMGSLWRSSWEGILVYQSKAGKTVNNVMLGKFGRNRTDVFEYAGVNTFREGRMEELTAHPTCKPVALLADLIRDVTPVKGIVLDAYLGSGSTILGAHEADRRGIGIELDGRYVDVAVQRIAEKTGHAAIHQNGMTFEQLADHRASPLGGDR